MRSLSTSHQDCFKSQRTSDPARKTWIQWRPHREYSSCIFFKFNTKMWPFLDLRSSAFSDAGSNVQWNPSPLFVRWDPEFIQALREIYEGFYNDSPASYESGLRTLNLLPAQDIFTQHFGQGDQRQVEFQLSHFHDTFHQTFTRCLEHEVNLHGNFLALGLMLACLYEHLETLSVPCNVRGAYEKVSAL